MFIAPAVTNQAKLHRSETDLQTHCAPTEQEPEQPGIYKHLIPTGFVSPRLSSKNKKFGPFFS